MSTLRIACLLAAILSPVPASADAAADEASLRHLKQVDWPRAYHTQDVALLGRILASEFQMVDGDGRWTTRADELAWVAANASAPETFRYEIRRLEIFGGDTAIVAGSGHMQGRDERGVWRTTWQSSNLLIKRDGRWQAIASHVSGVKTER